MSAFFDRIGKGLLITGTAMGLWMFGTSSIPFSLPQIEEPQVVQVLALLHRQAAVQAQERADYFRQMGKGLRKAQDNPSNQDTAAHCRYWADYYQRLAAEEKRIARQVAKGRIRHNPFDLL